MDKIHGIGARVKAAREAKGWSQKELALEVTRRGFKIGQSAIGNLERKSQSEPKSIAELASVLEVNVDWLRTGRGPKAPPDPKTFVIADAQNARMSGSGLPALLMWRSSPGGSGANGGVFMLNAHKGKRVERPAFLINEDKAFSFRVVGNENAKVYKSGDRLWVNPEERLEIGEDCLFLREPNHLEGSEAILAELVRKSDRTWVVKHHGPGAIEQTLSRAEWPYAWPIVGRERGRLLSAP